MSCCSFFVVNQKPTSLDSFLSRLPASVVRNGKVIDIRGDVAALLQPTPSVNVLKKEQQ